MGRKLCLALALLLLPVLGHAAGRQQVKDVEVRLRLMPLGGVVIHEIWDVSTGEDITEWYLVRENLGDMELAGKFQVMDETGELFELEEGEWDIHRTLAQKARKCGVVHKSDGVELCWGIGSYGDHTFHAFYSFINGVKTLNDYDMLHMQLVSPGLSTPPQHVKVVIEAKEHQLDTTNTRVWGFGYEGRTAFEDGKVVLESEGPLGKEDSVIALLRFEKGLFESPSVQERDFQEALDIAMEGADFGESDDYDYEEEGGFWQEVWDFTQGMLGLAFIYFCMVRPYFKWKEKRERRKKFKRILGVKDPSQVDWHREIPFWGDLGMAAAVLEKLGEGWRSNSRPLAEILRLVHQGYLVPSREMDGPVTLRFTDKAIEPLNEVTKEFYGILKNAAGPDNILQSKEFSTWARKNETQVCNWYSKASKRALEALNASPWYQSYQFTDEGKQEARKLVGLKNFLNDFTLVSIRETYEASVWKEYLVYAALFGLAEKVMAQLKDIDPKFFHELFTYDSSMLNAVLLATLDMSKSMNLAHIHGTRPSYTSSGSSYSGGHSSSRGYGGHSSHSGGHGYSGGGRGGGGR